MDYNKKRYCVYLITYHMVFVTKYRKPVISDEIGGYMKSRIPYFCERFGGELISAETDRDHIHVLVSMPPQVRPADLVRTLKTQLSKEIHSIPEYDRYVKQYISGDALWTPSYFICSTGSVAMDKVKEYVESQRTDEHHRKYEKTGRYRGRYARLKKARVKGGPRQG